jgi:alanyl-tRNA synthetase
MQTMGLNRIREQYLSFFETKGHLRLPSFSLVPKNDPSILLINAGMTPLKPYFTGAEVPPASRIATCQKCIRTPDIERVGKTARHGTYFEMLGNFSFGDYFKKEVIPWAWEFCTLTMGLPPEFLHVTVYLDDDEAHDIWLKDVGVLPSHISRLGKADNFWEHGTGPCGPCSEIYFDRGLERGCGSADCKPGCDCDRFVEFWNLVFTQFNKEEDGSYTPLAKKNIDTGMGLERLACILQGVDNLFEVDTIRAILDAVCTRTSTRYGADTKTDVAIRVITDHIRSTSMMIADGIIPSNEGRGYVLRRLLRRAARFGRMLGVEGTFLHEIAAVVVAESSQAYPELSAKKDYLQRVIRTEEERFAETILQGLGILSSHMEAARNRGERVLAGTDVFQLHDTYGFPLDLTREIASENDLDVDEAGFRTEMESQKRKAREALKEKTGSAWGADALPQGLAPGFRTRFSGYEKLSLEATAVFLVRQGEAGEGPSVTECANAGDRVIAIFDETPFYAESGGQIGDTGTASRPGFAGMVEDTHRTPDGKYLHTLLVTEGTLSMGDRTTLSVDSVRRRAIAANHTTTHLLHRVLRDVLGSHVAQSGSMVTPDRLRFDFRHFQPMTQTEKEEVERRVNRAILADYNVDTAEMSLEDARLTGATALFDEKYGDSVRVVSAGDFSQELCGGTHLARTSEACLFRLLSETGVAAGIRRIEATTGGTAMEADEADRRVIRDVAAILKSPAGDLVRRAQLAQDDSRALERRVEELTAKLAASHAGTLSDKAVEVVGLKLLFARVEAHDADSLRIAADGLRLVLGPSVIVLAAVTEGKISFVSMASPEAVAKGSHAGNILKEAAKVAGGGGGGRPDMAQAGGKDPSRLAAALEAAEKTALAQIGA